MAQHLFSPGFWKTSLTFSPISTWQRIKLGLAASASVWVMGGGIGAFDGKALGIIGMVVWEAELLLSNVRAIVSGIGALGF